jgi:hypothetical protein
MRRYGCAVMCVVVALLALTGSAALAQTQDGLLLRWTPKLGDVMLYKLGMQGDIEFKGGVPGLPEGQNFNFTVAGLARVTVLDVAQNGDITTQIKYEQLSANMLGQAVDLTPQFAGLDIRVIQTARGELVGASGFPQGMGSMGLDPSFGIAAYPEAPVGIGQSWTTPIPIPMLGPAEKLEVVSTLAGIDDAGGFEVANIRTTFDGKIDVGKMLAAMAQSGAGADLPEDAKIDAGFDLVGNTAVRLSDGRVLAVETSGKMSMKGDLASFGASAAFDSGGPKNIEMVMNFRMSMKDTNVQ